MGYETTRENDELKSDKFCICLINNQTAHNELIEEYRKEYNLTSFVTFDSCSIAHVYSIVYLITKNTIDRIIVYDFKEYFPRREVELLSMLCCAFKVEIINTKEIYA